MQLLFTEEYCQPERLFPFTATRQVQDIRIGILTIREKWEHLLGLVSADKKCDYYKDHPKSVLIAPDMQAGEAILLHGNVLPTPALAKAVSELQPGEGLGLPGYGGFAFRFSKTGITGAHSFRVAQIREFRDEPIDILEYAWQIFEWNDKYIRADFSLITDGRESAAPDPTNQIIGRENLFIEEGAVVSCAVINASTGPVYIGKKCLVMEGSVIRGPFSMGEGSVLKVGAKIYGATTLGPYCTGGGEIKNSVMMGWSNKAHDGYLGDSVIGHWCNLGAGTSNSNIKNTATPVKVWNHPNAVTDQTPGVKCGIFMGDHSRAAINTSFNTGTVIGVGANVFGAQGLTPKFIPSFSWGADGISRYNFEKFLSDAGNWMAFKSRRLTETEIRILKYVYDKEP